MVRAITGAKRIATELRGVEDGDELSIVLDAESADSGANSSDERDESDTIDGSVVRGHVHESREDIEGHDLEVVFDGDGIYDVYVDHTGPEDQAHYEASNRDFNVFAVPAFTDEELDVTALANWEDGFDVPDKTLEELDSEVEEDVDAELEATLDSIARTMTELQEVREGYRAIRRGEDTFADFEQRLVELELESGGTLALDDW